MTYTIWTCCGLEQEETREDAIGLAVAIMRGDHHSVVAVEGPHGEDLMPEVEAEDERRSKAWLEQQRQRPALMGRVQVAAPGGRWVTGEWIYTGEERDREMARLSAVFGVERVRWVPEVGG